MHLEIVTCVGKKFRWQLIMSVTCRITKNILAVITFGRYKRLFWMSATRWVKSLAIVNTYPRPLEMETDITVLIKEWTIEFMRRPKSQGQTSVHPEGIKFHCFHNWQAILCVHETLTTIIWKSLLSRYFDSRSGRPLHLKTLWTWFSLQSQRAVLGNLRCWRREVHGNWGSVHRMSMWEVIEIVLWRRSLNVAIIT